MRSTLDKLISGTGLLVAVVLLIAGGLLTWAGAFVGGQVHDQLADQAITMPSGDALASLPQADQDALKKYANQPLLKGPQAKAYADHFIHAHLVEMVQGTGIAANYAAVGAAASQACASDQGASEGTAADCTKYTALKGTYFQGDTLRGLLLYGYAFATIGTIAWFAAIAAYVGGVLLLILALLGFVHANRLHGGKSGPDAA